MPKIGSITPQAMTYLLDQREQRRVKLALQECYTSLVGTEATLPQPYGVAQSSVSQRIYRKSTNTAMAQRSAALIDWTGFQPASPPSKNRKTIYLCVIIVEKGDKFLISTFRWNSLIRPVHPPRLNGQVDDCF